MEQQILDKLHAHKEIVGITEKNKYLFFKPNSDTFTNVHTFMKKLTEEFNLDDKKAMRFTNLRKQVGTQAQVYLLIVCIQYIIIFKGLKNSDLKKVVKHAVLWITKHYLC